MKSKTVPTVHTTEVLDVGDPEKGQPEASPTFLPSEQWPTKPTALQASRKSQVFSTLYDAVCVLASVILMIKPGIVIKAWMMDAPHRGWNIDQTTKLTQQLLQFDNQMVTLFTIIFSVIVSTLVRRYALWKAQKGAYVAELEQLQGSTSFASTLKMVYSLRSGTRTSIVLVFIWAWYYLGSQSAQREYVFVNSEPHTKQNIGVPQSDFPSVYYDSLSLGNADDSVINTLHEDFEAANWYDTNRRARNGAEKPGADFDGYPMIPNILALQASIAAGRGTVATSSQRTPPLCYDTKTKWITMNSLTSLSDLTSPALPFTAMVGTPYSLYDPGFADGFFEDARADGVLDYYTTNYFNISCGLPSYRSFSAFPNGTSNSTMLSFNMTSTSSESPRDVLGNPLRTFEYWFRWQADGQNSNGLPSGSLNGSAMSTCNITSIQVDVRASCIASSCSPTQIRYANGSDLEQVTSYRTAFEDDAFAARFFSNFSLQHIMVDDLSGDSQTLTSQLRAVLSKGYNVSAAVNATQGLSVSQQINADPTYNNYLTSDLYPTLGKYFNTYYMLSQQVRRYHPNMTAINSGVSDGYYMPGKMNGAAYDPHHDLSVPWIAMDFIACSLLIVASIISIFLRVHTLAPDIFGYVSSLTRDNPNLKGALPDSGTGLSGIERARMMKGVKVKIGDCSGNHNDVAKVGLAVEGVQGSAAGASTLERCHAVRAEPLRPEMSVV